MPSHRTERVASQIQQELSRLLLTEAKDPRLSAVSITDVDVTPDLQQASVYYVLFGDEDRGRVAKGLEKAAGFLRTSLGQRVQLRHTPDLRFIYDDSLERGNQMEKLLDELRDAGEMGDADE